MTIEKLGKCLGYANGRKGVDNIISRNKHLKEEKYSVPLTMRATDGKLYSTRVFSERGIYEVAFLSNTAKAREFHSWVCDLLIALRKGNLTLATNNVSFSPELFNMIIEKHFGVINDRLLALEAKTPTKPDYWRWKNNVSSPLTKQIADKLGIEKRDVFDLIYDTMTSKYGFDRSFAINQMCCKYNTTEEFVIDAIADNPEYQRWFIDTANTLLNTYNQFAVSIPCPTVTTLDKVQTVILPLADKLQDKSANYAWTYNKVYNRITSKQGWKSLMTRTGCKTKKAVILKRDDLFKKFRKCVNEMLEED